MVEKFTDLYVCVFRVSEWIRRDMDPCSIYSVVIMFENFYSKGLQPMWVVTRKKERNGIEVNDSVSELGSLTTANLMEKVRGLQNLAYQLGLDECEYPDHIYLGAILCISWCVVA